MSAAEAGAAAAAGSRVSTLMAQGFQSGFLKIEGEIRCRRCKMGEMVEVHKAEQIWGIRAFAGSIMIAPGGAVSFGERR